MTSVYELKIGAEKLEVLLAIGEELTTLANTLNATKEKLSQIANGNDDALKSLAELKKEILAKKEATEQNAASAKNAQQKVEEILASIEKLQEQIKSTADKVENAGTLLNELNTLKEQIKTLLQNGIINDAAQSATQTYSSNLIEQKLETKASTGYSYSKAEANEKFNGLVQGINTAISAAAAAQSSADSKLGKSDKAADSAKLGGAAADKYMKTNEYNPTAASTPNTLALRDENGDFKGRRVTAENFLTTEKAQDDAIDENSEICYRAAQSSEAEPKQMRFATLRKITSLLKVEAATETKAGIVKLKNSITGSLSDTAVSENAVKEYVGKNASIGIGQSWQDVTSQRQIGVTYTNKTGRPIQLTIMCLGWADYTIKIGDVSISFGGGDQGRTSKQTYYGIVPNDAEYSLTRGSSFYWWELR